LGQLRRLDVPDAEHYISECEKVIAEVRVQIRTLGND
jgi:hypothetical protein